MSREIKVVKILVEDQGKFLVLQKSDSYDWKAGKWELPGGKIEADKGEDRLDAARRELEHETGLRSGSFQDVVRTEIEEFNEKEVVNCWILHTSDISRGVKLSDEHQDFRWVDPEEFMEMDWHRDAGYGIPPMKYLEDYLQD